mgnify:CR=1 FL=1
MKGWVSVLCMYVTNVMCNQCVLYVTELGSDEEEEREYLYWMLSCAAVKCVIVSHSSLSWEVKIMLFYLMVVYISVITTCFVPLRNFIIYAFDGLFHIFFSGKFKGSWKCYVKIVSWTIDTIIQLVPVWICTHVQYMSQRTGKITSGTLDSFLYLSLKQQQLNWQTML